MCGIAGFLCYEKTLDKSLLQAMTAQLAHRGPDAEGFFQDEYCGLGHRRLSILDLSERANQPFFSKDGRYVVVFNGEIYNFREVAEKLQIQPRTQSDTEILVEAFAQKGMACVQMFNGMFAFAVYDTHKKELYLCRDRIGKKPIYYFWNGHYFAFASELKALMVLPFIPKDLNYLAIEDFLHLGYIPRPHSIYEDVFKMFSGYWLKVSRKGIEENMYWDIQACLKKQKISDETEAEKQLETLLQSSIRYRLISDVPLGVFLSGGIDSSTVVSLAQSVSSEKIKTFSIGFENEQYNEAPFARQVAQHLQTDHYELILSPQEAKNLIPEIIDVYDEPFADSSAVPTMLISAFAKKYVSVALAGDGGDELFQGYGTYAWAERLKNPYLKPLRFCIAQLLKLKKTLAFQKGSQMFRYPKGKHLASHIFSQEQFLFSQAEVEDLITFPVTNAEPLLSSQFGLMNCSPREQQALFDLQYYLQDDLLVKVDRASMRYALEVRSPLLDYRVIEFALNLDTSLKYRNKTTKYLLKKILFRYVPAELFKRPKWGFAIPLTQWLRTDLRYLIDEFLNHKVVTHYDLVKYEKVKELKDKFLKGNDFYYNRLWVLIVLHQFLKKNFD
ncbi:MAG: asparagine synthase (glutamine-hydrolyzing) [Raineya sp.]|nr:asparagine synthase (glutamine-hydrolyzing) [Raineya sp.]